MENIVQELKGMSVDDLRGRLQSYGEEVGPITNTTKFLFVKKLAKKIYQERYPNHVPADNKIGTPNRSSADADKINASGTSKSVVKGVSNVGHTYYGICLPVDLQDDRSLKDAQLVFTDKAAALKAVKAYKGSRFKAFKNLIEAEKFSRSKTEISSPLKPTVSEFSQVPSAEAIAFKAPKMPDLVSLRRSIEKGDEETFRETVWSNPRYLISSGDTPVILQEGFRYNALHVAAKSNQPVMCRLIIDTIQSPDFIKTLYPMDSEMTCNNRIKFITDLYLNMPDRGFCESPLHFACKFGYADVVEVFASHPITDRRLVNKHGETPSQVVCSRCSSPNKSVSERIQSLLEDSCFVPLLRSEDNCSQPVIGEPWSPDSQSSGHSLTSSSQSPRDPQLVVRAYAGPMSPAVADTFHRRWVTPPSGSPDHVKRRLSEIRREDCDKGVERIGRKLAQDLKVPWAEYWQFLKAYVDLRSSQGLNLLNNHLRGQYCKLFPEESAIDEGRLLEKNLRNSSLSEEFEEDSPSILGYSDDAVFGPYGPSGEADGLARLDLSITRDTQIHAKKRESRSSSSSSGSSESNYSSCRSGSESDDETYHIAQGTNHSAQGTNDNAQGASHNTQGTNHNMRGTNQNRQVSYHNVQESDHNTRESNCNTQDSYHSAQESYHNTKDSYHSTQETQTSDQENVDTMSASNVRPQDSWPGIPLQNVPMCGGSRGDWEAFIPPDGTPQGTDAFTKYRSTASSSTDLDVSPVHSVGRVSSSGTSSDIRLPPCAGQRHAQSTDRMAMSLASMETLVSSLAADMESMTISWALNDSSSNENESYARLASSAQGTSDSAKPESSVQVSWSNVGNTSAENRPEKMVTDADERVILKQSRFTHLPGEDGSRHVSSVAEFCGSPLSKPSGVSVDNQFPDLSTVSDESQVSSSSVLPHASSVPHTSTVSQTSSVSQTCVVSQTSAESQTPTVSYTGSDAIPGTPKTPVQSQLRCPSRTSRHSQHLFPQVFIEGTEASKLDVDVLRAIEDVPVDPQLYPYIHRWKKLVTSFDEDIRQSWPTPARVHSRTALTNTQDRASSPVLQLYAQSPLASAVTSQSAGRTNQRLQPSRLDLDSF